MISEKNLKKKLTKIQPEKDKEGRGWKLKKQF